MAMWCAERFGGAAALATAVVAAAPSLAALTIAEPESRRAAFLPAGRRVHSDIKHAMRRRPMLVAMIVLALPAGSGAAANLFPAIAGEDHVGAGATILLTVFSGSFLTVLGCLVGGAIADRVNRRGAYLGTTLTLGASAIVMAMAP